MTRKEKIIARLENLSQWTIDDFIFYGDIFDELFIFDVEFDPKKPEIGWSLFQQKLEEAKKEFETTGDVISFKALDDLNDEVQNLWQSQNN
jgi:hypothetical protein